MKIGIIGHGFVGQAVENAFMCESIVVDPASSTITIKQLMDETPLFIFVCVPTPQNSNGSCDTTAADAVLADLSAFSTYDPIVVLKSTVPPHKIAKMTSLPNIQFVYNPEFLRQEDASRTFLQPDMHLFGGNRSSTEALEHFYTTCSRCAPCITHHTDAKTASLVKYSINAFLATKIVFMNHLKEVHEASNVQSSFEEFAEIFSSDSRIGNSHMQVPGNDGKYGYGGACFPKDVKAFIDYYSKVNVGSDLLQAVDEINESYFRIK